MPLHIPTWPCVSAECDGDYTPLSGNAEWLSPLTWVDGQTPKQSVLNLGRKDLWNGSIENQQHSNQHGEMISHCELNFYISFVPSKKTLTLQLANICGNPDTEGVIRFP